MDNRMIDVAIGLALVFAMTSLMVTALQEILSQVSGKRGKVLLQALKSFVGDDEGFVRTLLAQPQLRSLSPPRNDASDKGAPRTPSYIEADSLVSALIGGLVATHAGGVRPPTPAELVNIIVRMAPQDGKAAPASQGLIPNQAFAQGLASLVNGVEADWPGFEARVAAWYDAVNERATGWFKRGVRISVFVVGFVTAAIVNINPLVIGPRLWEDEPLRAAMVSAAQQTVQAREANKVDPARPQDRTQAAAAQDAARAGVAESMASLRAAALSAFRRRDTSEPASADLIEAATRVIDLGGHVEAALEADDAERPALMRSAAAANDRVSQDLKEAATLEWLEGPQQTLRDAIAAALAPTPAKKEAPLRHTSSCVAFKDDTGMFNVCQRMADLSELQRAGQPIGWTAAAWPGYIGEPCVKDGRPCTAMERVTDRDTLFNLPIALLGWIITALACTLGAPFWFDALGKLVKLRSSGEPPATAKGADSSGTPPGSQLARSGGPTVVGPSGAAVLPGGTDLDADRASKPRVAMSDVLTDAEHLLDEMQTKQVQRALQMPADKLSGWFDGATRQAIRNWQGANDESATGELTLTQIDRLLARGHGKDSPAAEADDHGVDGCNVDITDPTNDADLPGARGGVAP
jgi:hypothetical protein